MRSLKPYIPVSVFLLFIVACQIGLVFYEESRAAQKGLEGVDAISKQLEETGMPVNQRSALVSAFLDMESRHRSHISLLVFFLMGFQIPLMLLIARLVFLDSKYNGNTQ